jgi:hypothetical protein
MIIVCKGFTNQWYKLFFKVTKNPFVTKELCKEILRKYRPFYGIDSISVREGNDLNFSYTSNMISFSAFDKELAYQVYSFLKKNKHFSTVIYNKSISVSSSPITQYLINSELTYPIKFRESFLKKVALNIYEKTGYLSKVEDTFITVLAKDVEEMQKIMKAFSQGGRVAIRLPGNKKMTNDKGETVQVGKVLFSNYQGRELFDKCLEKEKHVFIVLNNQVLYELRMMFRLDQIKHPVLYLECDGVIYGSLTVNEKSLTRPEILFASFESETLMQNFIRKLKRPLPKLELHHSETVNKESMRVLAILSLLSIALFLFLSKRRRKTVFFIISSILFSAIIYSPEIGIIHMKILAISSLLTLGTCTLLTGLNIFVCNTILLFVVSVFKYVFSQELIWNLFFSSTAQLLIYQSFAAFLYRLYNSNDKL